VDITDFVTPIASSDWNETQFGVNESTINGNLDFIDNLNTKTDATILISNNKNSLESGSLTGLSLFLD
jgi:hypothetical protein